MAHPTINFNDVETLAESVLSLSGTAGLSMAIIQNGETKMSGHFGFQDNNSKRRPDDDTAYLISSMSKPFIGVALGVLMSRYPGQFDWDTKVEDFIPEIRGKNTDGQPITISDLLCHRTKFYRYDPLWVGAGGETLLKTQEQIIAVASLPDDEKVTKSKLEYSRNYSNIGFSVLAVIIEIILEKYGGKHVAWGEFLRGSVFLPLGMKRTTSNIGIDLENDDNVAKGHSAEIDDHLLHCMSSAARKKTPQEAHEKMFKEIENLTRDSKAFRVTNSVLSKVTEDGSYLSAPAGLVSTVSDLSKFCRAFMSVFNGNSIGSLVPEELCNGIKSVQAFILAMIKGPKVSYAGGWNALTAPWDLVQKGPGEEGTNPKAVAKAKNWGTVDELVVQKNGKSKAWPFFQHNENKEICLWHNGNMVGATSFFLLLPESNSAVVVLGNSRTYLAEGPNLIGMVLADYYLRGNGNSFGNTLGMTRKLLLNAATTHVLECIQHEYSRKETFDTVPADAGNFSHLPGKYYIAGKAFHLDVYENEEGQLGVRLQGMESQGFLLYPAKEQTSSTVKMSLMLPINEQFGGSVSHPFFEVQLVFESSWSSDGPIDVVTWHYNGPKNGHQQLPIPLVKEV